MIVVVDDAVVDAAAVAAVMIDAVRPFTQILISILDGNNKGGVSIWNPCFRSGQCRGGIWTVASAAAATVGATMAAVVGSSIANANANAADTDTTDTTAGTRRDSSGTP